MNKPVAWMYKCLLSDNMEVDLEKPPAQYENPIPLYTHPVKELTDEEIDDIGREHLTDGDGAIEFARAILRKAQEK